MPKRESLLEESIELLKVNANDDLINEIIMQSARHKEIRKMVRNDIISFEQANISKAKIRYALLELIYELETKQKEVKVKVTNKNIYILFLAVILILFTFVTTYFFFLKDDSLAILGDKFEEPISEDQPNEKPHIEGKIDTSSRQSTNPSPKPINPEIPTNNEPIHEKNNNEDHGFDVYPIIKGEIVDDNHNGIADVLISTPDGAETISDEFGLFTLNLVEPIQNYSSKIYLYYKSDSLQGKKLVRVGQTNVVLNFKK